MTDTLYTGTPTVSVTDNRGLAVRTLKYNRNKKEVAVDELITATTYSAAGFALSQTDPRLGSPQANTPDMPTGQLANFQCRHDLAGRVLRTDSVDAGSHWSLFDIEGRSVWQRDARGAATRTEYDAFGRLIQVSEQLVGKEGFIALEKLIYGDNDSDSVLDRTAAQSANLCGVVSQQFDTAGQLTTPGVTLTGQPQAQVRRLLAATQGDPDWDAMPQPVLEQNAYKTDWTYNALGALLTQTDANGNVQYTSYDVAGRVAAASLKQLNHDAPQALLKSIHYSAHGQVESETAGNGVTTHYTYYPKTLRLKKSVAKNAQDKVLQQLEYQYDLVGNILSIEDKVDVSEFFNNEEVKHEATYAYDALYQLVCATGREQASARQGSRLPKWIGPPPSNARVNYTREYQYDRGGNLTEVRGTRGSARRFTQTMSIVDGNNRLKAVSVSREAGLHRQNGDTVDHFKYDANGNLGALGIKELKSLQWNGRNQLCHVVLLSRDNGDFDEERYQYDGNGQRIRKITSTLVKHDGQRTLKHRDEVIYLPGLELRRRYDVWIEMGKVNKKITRELHFITASEAGRCQIRVLHWAVGQPDGIDSDQFRYSLNDHLGSSMLELDQHASLLTYEEYYPYGGTAVWAAKSEINAACKHVRYSGKERDATGLYYYGFRYYAPWLGRWLNPDPAGTVDGLNLYRMVRNNPIAYVDPSGKHSKQVSGAAAGMPAEVYRDKKAFYEAIRPLIKKRATREKVDAGKSYGWHDESKKLAAWHVYQAVLYAGPILVLGRLANGEFYRDRFNVGDNPAEHDRALTRNPVITESLVDNVGKAADDDIPIRMRMAGLKGILKAVKWSPLVNDALILGAIHSGKDIHFASRRTKKNIKQASLIVMGRELIALHASGRFKFVTSGDGENLGDVAAFNHSHEQRPFGFKEYLEAIKRYTGDKKRLKELWNTPATPQH